MHCECCGMEITKDRCPECGRMRYISCDAGRGTARKAMSDSTTDLATAFKERATAARWRAERENATARLELANIRERLALVLSQHEPVATLGLDRDALRKVVDYVRTGRDVVNDKKASDNE